MIDISELFGSTTGVSIGNRVTVTDVTDRRGGRRQIDGTVVYVSRYGWATVALDCGYRESYWLADIKEGAMEPWVSSY